MYQSSAVTRSRLTDLLPGRAVAHVPVQCGLAAVVNRSVTRVGELQLGSVICVSALRSAVPAGAVNRSVTRAGRAHVYQSSACTRAWLTNLLPGRAAMHVPVQCVHAHAVNRSVTRAGGRTCTSPVRARGLG